MMQAYPELHTEMILILIDNKYCYAYTWLDPDDNRYLSEDIKMAKNWWRNLARPKYYYTFDVSKIIGT